MINIDPHNRLAGVHPNLIKVVKAAALITKQPFTVIEGVRTAERQAELYAQGRTKPGPVVTWVHVSNHQVKADGYGHAVDLGALKVDGSIDWNTNARYDTLKEAMFAAAIHQIPVIGLRWGADWDMDGVPREHGETDEDHFELH